MTIVVLINCNCNNRYKKGSHDNTRLLWWVSVGNTLIHRKM